MSFFQKKKVIKADFAKFTLIDIVIMMEQENYFEESSYSLVEKVHSNHIIWKVKASRYLPSEIHVFRYSSEAKEWTIESRYGSDFLRSFIILLFPLCLFFGEMNQQKWVAFFLMTLAIFVYLVAMLKINLGDSAENMERDITIRMNKLLRQAGLTRHL